jgi:hypothetical protein
VLVFVFILGKSGDVLIGLFTIGDDKLLFWFNVVMFVCDTMFDGCWVVYLWGDTI